MKDTEHYKNNIADFARDYETGSIREVTPHERKILDALESRCTVSLFHRKMIVVSTPK